MPESHEDRWQSRPIASALLRGAVFAVPIALSAIVSVWFARTLIPANGASGLMIRLGCSFAISIVVLRLTDRLARKLLPLAVLWRLSLAFPTAAPSRWKLARQAGNVKELERIAIEAREQGVATEPSQAAEHILSLVAAVEAHDRGTRGHSERVRIYADLAAEHLNLAEEDRNKLRWAALLHDVGKIMVPSEVLNKPDKLDEGEWDLVKAHPEQGMQFIEPLREWLGEWALAIEQHHERYDGKGYPHGLSGWRISRAARIVAVADAYEVMTARRAYRRPVRASEARKELVKCSGTQFDPTIVRAFLQVSLGRLRVVSGPLAWLAQAPFLRGVEQIAVGTGAATTGSALVLGFVPGVPVPQAPALPARPPAQIVAIEPSATPSMPLLPDPAPSEEPYETPSPITEPTTSGTFDPTPTPGPSSSSPEPSPIATPTDPGPPEQDVEPNETPTGRPSSERKHGPVPSSVGGL